MHTRPQIANTIAKQTLDQHDTTKLKKAIASYLLEENRVDELDSIMRDVIAYRAAHGHVEVTVVSAYPISAAVKADVLEAVKQQSPGAASYVINQRLDPDVIGGIRIEFDGHELDLTVQAKLNKFKQLTAARKD